MGDSMDATSRLEASVLFSFSTAHLSATDKVKFFYALNGRDGESGVSSRYRLSHLGPTLLLCPVSFEKELSEFFLYWGCKINKASLWVEGGGDASS